MNNNLYKYLLSAVITLCAFTACNTDDTEISEFNKKDVGNHTYIIPKESTDTSVVFIESSKDLQQILTPTAEKYKNYLLRRGWHEESKELTSTRAISKARVVRTDTVYVYRYSVDYSSDPSVYARFNAKFSRAMVDSINKVVDSEYRISTKKTYICEWRLFCTFYDLTSNEQVASRPSLLCALAPATKSGYTERGYSLYTHESSNGSKQAQLNSFQLFIICEKVSHSTLRLDIDWPFRPKSTPKNVYRGYEFIYAVSKRI